VVRGTASAIEHPWTLSQRYLTDQIDRATWRTTLIRRLTPDLAVGVEVNPGADEIGPLANWRLASETARRPSLMLGTSSDRIGTPYGRAYYLTAGKSVKLGGQAIGPYVGLLWSTYDDQLLFPAGLNVPLSGGWSSQLQYDGRYTHLMASHTRGRTTLGVLAVRMRDPGLTVSMGF
jgi:hypothetical protein